MSNGCKCPCRRICGGVFVVMWRSLPPISTILLSNSLKLAAMLSSSPQNSGSMHRFAGDLFQSRHTVHHLDQPASAERNHAALDRLLLQFHGGSTDENQFTNLVVNLHHLVQSGATLISGVVAGAAALTFLG